MKFLPTSEQVKMAGHDAAIKSMEEAAELLPVTEYETLNKLWEGVCVAIGMETDKRISPDRHYKHGLLLAMKIGWCLRERAEEGVGLAQPEEEAEIEAMFKELRGGTGEVAA